MTIQCVESEFCKVDVHYVADPKVVEQKRQEAVEQLRQSAIPGFRPGKAPDWAIKAKMKDKIEAWMKRELVASAYDEILFETKMKPIGYPKVNQAELHEKNFSCNLTVLKKPEFELKQYKDFEIPRPHQEKSVSDASEEMLQALREQYGDVSAYGENDFVELKDQVTLDYKGSVEGETLTEFSKEGVMYTVGQSIFPEFDDNILGMKAGETRSFDVVFGENAFEELKGKKATFEVTVHMGLKRTPAALDDDFASKVGFKSFDELRKAVEGTVSAKLNIQQKKKIEQQVISRVLKEHDFQVPSWLAQMEAQQLAAQYGANWAQLTREQKEMLATQARDNVKLSLIFDSIRENEPESIFSDSELLAAIKRKVEEEGQDPEKFLVEAQRDGRLLGMVTGLRNQAMLDWLVQQSKLVD